MAISSKIPNELFIEVLKNLNGVELVKMQMTSATVHSLIEKNSRMKRLVQLAKYDLIPSEEDLPSEEEMAAECGIGWDSIELGERRIWTDEMEDIKFLAGYLVSKDGQSITCRDPKTGTILRKIDSPFCLIMVPFAIDLDENLLMVIERRWTTHPILHILDHNGDVHPKCPLKFLSGVPLSKFLDTEAQYIMIKGELACIEGCIRILLFNWTSGDILIDDEYPDHQSVLLVSPDYFFYCNDREIQVWNIKKKPFRLCDLKFPQLYERSRGGTFFTERSEITREYGYRSMRSGATDIIPFLVFGWDEDEATHCILQKARLLNFLSTVTPGSTLDFQEWSKGKVRILNRQLYLALHDYGSYGSRYIQPGDPVKWGFPREKLEKLVNGLDEESYTFDGWDDAAYTCLNILDFNPGSFEEGTNSIVVRIQDELPYKHTVIICPGLKKVKVIMNRSQIFICHPSEDQDDYPYTWFIDSFRLPDTSPSSLEERKKVRIRQTRNAITKLRTEGVGNEAIIEYLKLPHPIEM